MNRFESYRELKHLFDYLQRERDIYEYNSWPLEDLQDDAAELVRRCEAHDAQFGGDSLSDLQGIT